MPDSNSPPAKRAGRSIARVSSSSDSGPTRELVVRHQRGERRVRRTLAVKVSSHRQHRNCLAVRDRHRMEQIVEKRSPNRRVFANRENLFGLVHQHDQPSQPGASRSANLVNVCRDFGSSPNVLMLSRSRASLIREAPPARAVKATVRLSRGSRPGLKIKTGQRALPSRAPFFKEAASPARASEDLPLPEAPRIARKRFSTALGAARSATVSHSVSASRPKKKGACSTSKTSSPR